MGISRKTWLLIAFLTAIAAAIVVVPAVADPAATTKSGGAITAVKVVRETDAQTTSSATFVDLPGASTTITVPSGEKALILARFSAESDCYGGAANDWCSVRILIGGSEAAPASGTDFAFDSNEDGGAASQGNWESHSMDRSRGALGEGTYTVKVQWMTVDTGVTFRLDDWSLTVERVKKS
ncbi:MAG: hypothetical protein HYS09_09845 [Chloroflexi bacterium]|nr:hypothetical protein [Chloroflexota bacterium]